MVRTLWGQHGVSAERWGPHTTQQPPDQDKPQRTKSRDSNICTPVFAAELSTIDKRGENPGPREGRGAEHKVGSSAPTGRQLWPASHMANLEGMMLGR